MNEKNKNNGRCIGGIQVLDFQEKRIVEGEANILSMRRNKND